MVTEDKPQGSQGFRTPQSGRTEKAHSAYRAGVSRDPVDKSSGSQEIEAERLSKQHTYEYEDCWCPSPTEHISWWKSKSQTTVERLAMRRTLLRRLAFVVPLHPPDKPINVHLAAEGEAQNLRASLERLTADRVALVAEREALKAALRELHEELNTMEADPKMLNRIIREALRE